MEIRKLFKAEMSHRVVNASTERCAYSCHGHSVLIEVFIKGNKLDNAGMLVDFSLLKKYVGAFLDSFDHCHVLWDKEDREIKEFFKKNNLRWIELPVNPSAENLALISCFYINEILKATQFNNGEGELICSHVIWHETSTGYADAYIEDLHMLPEDKEIKFSIGVIQDWPDALKNFIDHPEQRDSFYLFHNPCIQQQVKS